MSAAVSLPVTRPTGRALVVAGAASRAQPVAVLQRLGFACGEADDPYTAVLELCRRPMVYRALILSLTSLYKEELAVIQSVKQRFPHLEVWLTQTDGRHAAMAEAMRLGADGLLSDDGLHRIAFGASEASPPPVTSARPTAAPAAEPQVHVAPTHDDDELGIGEPILTADELRALLQEQPAGGREG